jgi:hypothetical protein
MAGQWWTIRQGAVVVCKRTDSPTMDCPDVCLEAFWLQEWEWVLEDCHKRSCWKNSIGVSVPRPGRLDVYVCSESCWLCLTVVYWLLECNKVPSWIENPEYATIPKIIPTIPKYSCLHIYIGIPWHLSATRIHYNKWILPTSLTLAISHASTALKGYAYDSNNWLHLHNHMIK